MAYQTGNAQTIQIILSKLSEFAAAIGWQIKHKTETKLYLSTQDDSAHYALEFLSNVLYTIPCTSFDFNKSAIAQTGSPSVDGNCYKKIYTRTTDLEEGNFISYDFFGTLDYLHVVVEIKNEQFRHFGIGKLAKEAEFNGGEYAYGTYIYSKSASESNSRLNVYGMSSSDNKNSTAVIRVDNFKNETKSLWYLYCTNSYYIKYKKQFLLGNAFYALGRSAMPEDYYTYHPDSYLVNYSQSKFGHSLIPAPNSLIAHKVDNTFVRLGIIPDRYECTMRGIPPKTILEINGERWKIIPSAGFNEFNSSRKTSNPDNTGIQAVAYRIVES
ncbi:hypothetical protein QJU96_10020 [Pasteurella skyensis]|uniref:Uncharacterized protein n=1 Tax=Phocoenobacter skyensis TaxID=97481 RepID=A0AAJ6P362_9PAST|nr:hypothetical protein [Pasteurella skyensis]MDP8171618.1 hypothetical protein [Pasteurella skyensis]MDP8175454.1 hypothetical protein [Pasteurella skyensis]